MLVVAKNPPPKKKIAMKQMANCISDMQRRKHAN
jgi:hypothetical protein